MLAVINRHLYTAVVFAWLLIPVAASTQDDDVRARVDIGVQQDEVIWTGQQVTVNLDLKTTGFSFSNTQFNLPEVSGGFLMQTDTTTIKLNERIDGQTWQIIRYPLALYPQKPGRLEIPPIDIRFTTSAGFGSTEKAFAFQTEALELAVSLPPGAREGDLVVTTDSFELDYDWQPALETARTGDALTLTVSRRAGDISAMLLPPLPVFRTEGVAAYPQAPEIIDKTDRGDLNGVRTDSIIWVLEKPGAYEFPGIRFQWWDPDNTELKQQVVPGLSLDVAASSVDDAQAAKVEETTGGVRSIVVFVLAGLLAAVLWWRFAHNARKKAPDNEKSTFAKLQKACKSNRAAQTYTAIYAWLEYAARPSAVVAKPVTLDTFAQAWGDEKLAVELQQLQKAVTSRDSSWAGKALADSLRRARRKMGNTKTSESKIHIDPLNP